MFSCHNYCVHVIAAIAEVYKNEGNDAFKREEFSDAIAFYSEGIKVNCRDDELNAKLYNNRSMANFYSGKTMFHNSLAQSRKPLHNGHLGTKGKGPLWRSRSVIMYNNFFGGGATCFFFKKGFFSTIYQQNTNSTETETNDALCGSSRRGFLNKKLGLCIHCLSVVD